MPLFDGYIAVDWSASAEPVWDENSIWIAVYDANGMRELINPGTRHETMDHIARLLTKATVEGRRLLCGFDFSFGYPEGTARKFAGGDGWEAVWSRIAGVIKDHPDNSNNSFHAAAEFNGHFQDEGPFWGLHHTWNIEGLSATKAPADSWGNNLPPNLRYAETVLRNNPAVNPKPQEVWKLFYQGNVGRQALTGIARLEALRHCRDDVQVWPFETLGEGTHHVLAEIYPSLIDPCPGDEVLDARQVKAVAETLRELDLAGLLAGYLQAPQDMPVQVRQEEGAILGMHDPEGFRAVAQATPCRGAGAVTQGGYGIQYNEADARNEFQLPAPPYVPRDQQPLFQELQRRLGPDLGIATVDQIVDALDWLEPNDPDEDYQYLVYLRAFLQCLKGWWETNDEWDFGQAFLWAVHMTYAMLPSK